MQRAVSIIMRTKNRPLLLRRAFRSVLAQSFWDWGLVVVNDGGEPLPVDNLVAEHAARLGDRVIVIHHDVSRGMEAASNVGLHASQSEFCVIHDDDDSWHASFLEETVNHLRARPQDSIVQGVVTHSIRIQEDIVGDEIRLLTKEPFNDQMKAVSLFKMAIGNLFPPISFLYRRRAHEHIGFFREDLPVLGDWEFNLRFLQKFEISVLPRPLAYYHHRVSKQSDIYNNTVIANVGTHHVYDALLRNELLRSDLANNTLGLGFVVNIAKVVDELNHDVRSSLRENFFPYLKDRIYHLVQRLSSARK